jgi:GH24 family phage-related lysozyme (muramidase)
MAGQYGSTPKILAATNRNPAEEKLKSVDAVLGIYLGEVTSTKDLERMGRVQVFISALSKDKEQNTGLYDCLWSSPFAGSTPAAAIGNKIEQYQDTQKSYGMWMIPPDVGNLVLVAFGNGSTKLPICMGCLFPQKYTYMTPGMAAGKSYGDPNVRVPVAEKNRKDQDTNHNSTVRPIHADFAAHIVAQGLINDPVRGAGSSSSRRESPSEVFGILTPGPRDPSKVNHRLGGHQFIMDDSLQNRMIRLRTAGGNQLLMDDGTGSIYMINKSGKGWAEIDSFGNINLFGEGSINMRAKGNFNLRADKNINIEAGNDVNIKAAGDNVGDQYLGINPIGALGLPPLGTGGSIRLEAAADLTQYASLNAQLTANGGDIDISAGGRVAATASGPTGISMLSATGGIAMQSTLPISMLSAAGFSVTAGAPASIIAPLILLNSGGAPARPALPAVPAPQIGISEFKDQPSGQPEFDYQAALRGENAIKNNGKRPGKEIKIKTIVTNLVTAEPYAGHFQSDPSRDDPFARGSDDSLVSNLPANAVIANGAPADVQTPGGMQAGIGYTDGNGNTISQRENTTGTNTATGIALSASNMAQSASGAATSAATQAGNLKSLNGLPTYANVQNVKNNFSSAAEKKLLEIGGIQKLVDGIKVALPPIRFPTTNAVQQKVLGASKQLKEYEAQQKQFAISGGLPANLNSDVFNKMRKTIGAVIVASGSVAALSQGLKQQGITAIPDTTGSLIFKDNSGNMIVDFSNGLGDIGDSLSTASELNLAYDSVKDVIDVPLNNNQAMAIASFAQHIGIENFRNSNVARALNEGKYESVPRLMKTWSLGPAAGADPGTSTTELVYRSDYDQRRTWETEIFQSPDNLDIAPPVGSATGELNFQQMAEIVRFRREEFISQNISV